MDAISSNATSKKPKKRDQSLAAIEAIENKSDSQQGEFTNGADSSLPHDSIYVKDLQKNIRNINKKLTAMQKLDSVIAENPHMSLDDLVTARKINADQKAQALKKPHLQANLAQLEEQLVQFRKHEEEFKTRQAVEKAELEAAHKAELANVRTDAMKNAEAEFRRSTKERLLILSKFLRAAAARRQIDDDDSEDGKAFEGVLLLLYGGDDAAVDAAEKLIAGEGASVTSTEGNLLGVTYERIKQLSLEHSPFVSDDLTVASADDNAIHSFSSQTVDPTVSYVAATEPENAMRNNRSLKQTDTVTAPPQSVVDGDAANASAQDSWERDASHPESTLAESWVSVSRELQETDSTPTMVNPLTVQTWADEPQMPIRTAESLVEPTPSSNDGFSEVHHGRGGRGRNGHFSDYRGNGSRGRGMVRGDIGRGRGAFRGERGRPRPRGNRGKDNL